MEQKSAKKNLKVRLSDVSASGVRKCIELSAETGTAIVGRDELLSIPDKEGEYGVGDVIWAKVQGFPFWPCMVAVDPIGGGYSKISGISYKAERVYHVQYFGPQALRGWTSVGMVMPFEGKQKYFEKFQQLRSASPKSKSSKITAKYAVKPTYKKKWEQSVEEAEEALKLDIEERVRTHTFDYILTTKANMKRISDTQMSNAKRKKLSASPEDVYDFDEDADEGLLDVSQSNPGLMWRKRVQKGDFDIYIKNHIKKVKKENPNSSLEEINDILKRRWDLLSADLRALYVRNVRPSFSDNDTSGQSYAKGTPTANSNGKRRKSKSVSEPKEVKQDESSNFELNDDSDSEHNLMIAETPIKKSGKRGRKSKSNLDLSANGDSVNGKKSINGTEKLSPPSNKKAKRSKSASKPQTTANDKKNDESISKPISNNTDSALINFGIDFSDEFASSEDASSTSDPEVNEKAVTVTDKFCALCNDDESESLILCQGQCLQMFHKKCVNYQESEAPFKCSECETGKHKCFICKSLGETDTQKCSESKCGKFYHSSCLKKNYPTKVNESEGSFVCPLHFCLNCHLESQSDKEFRPSRRRLVKCISCPTAYHLGDYCIAAGTVQVSQNYVICPDHFESSKKKKNDKHLNVNYCFSCLTGGQLVCCESCPAAFHTHCLDYEFDNDSNFYCNDCTQRKPLHYGDIVWVKLGFYRWWPGRICHPKSVPDNVMKLSHSIGEFPVYFFGSHDYYWVHKGRVFLLMEGDSKAVAANNGGKKSSKSLMKTFKLAMEEAADAFKIWQESKIAVRKAMLINKPPPYVHIKSNRPVGPKMQNAISDESQIAKCECDAKGDNPCSDDHCLNRALMIECDPKKCDAGDKCTNQRFKKREYADCKPFKTETAGWGLRALQDVSKGQFVIEYVGEIIDEEECERRLKEMADNNQSNFYFLTIDKDKIIDAGPKANLARFMNHSCQPNCETQKWMVNGATRVGLFALSDIPAGSELTFNYNLVCRGNEKMKCMCGAPNCSGFIGVRPNKTDEIQTKKSLVNGNSTKKKKRKSEKKDFEKMHDDECFSCGEGGSLIMCDKKGCPKSYHLECLKLKDIPKGKWECPRHFCDQCGKSATAMCSFCPNSLCKEHAIPSKLTQLPDGGLLCSDHSNDDINGVLNEPEGNAGHEQQEEIENGRKQSNVELEESDSVGNNALNTTESQIINASTESASDDQQCSAQNNSMQSECEPQESTPTADSV